MRAHSANHPIRVPRLAALLALTLVCLLAGPTSLASAQDPVAATTQAVAGVTAGAERQVPAVRTVRDVVQSTEAVRKPAERVPAQVNARVAATVHQAGPADPVAPQAQPAAPAAAPAPARAAPPAPAQPDPAGTPKAAAAAREPARGAAPARASAAERREARAVDAAVLTSRERQAVADAHNADGDASARAAMPDQELPRPGAPSDGDHGVAATGAAVAGTGAAVAGVAVLAAILMLLRPARRGTPLRLPSPVWGSAVLTLSIERPG